VPICKAYDIDLIHFGVIMALNLAIGMFHPPFGLNIFVVQALTRALVILTYVPWLSLYLTSLI
jgi:C4-dicarboxylate transporter DctM subunit